MRHSRASRRLLPSPAKKAPFHGHFTQSFRPKTRCLMCPVSRALSHEAPPLCPRAQPPDRGPNISDSNHVIRKKRRRPRTGGGPRHVGRFTLTLAVRTYPSLRPACLRSSYAADNPIPIRHRIASERDGRPGSPLRHSSMSCCHSRSSRKLTTGVCPIRGRPRFFRITTFESVMRRVLQQSAHTGNPSLRKPSRAFCRVGGCLTVARPDRLRATAKTLRG